MVHEIAGLENASSSSGLRQRRRPPPAALHRPRRCRRRGAAAGLWVEVARRLAALADQRPIPSVGCVEVYDEEGKVAVAGEVVRGE